MRTLASAAALAVVLAAGAGSAVIAQAPAAPSKLYAFMTEIVGPAVNPIWEKSYADQLSDADWESLTKAARELAEAAPVIAVGGPAPEERGRANSPVWQEWAGKFTETANAVSRAVAAKDQAALAMAGDTLVEVCEGCHTAFPAQIP